MDCALRDFIQRHRNAREAIAQIRRGEWTPHYNKSCGEHLAASRGTLELWIGNGAWFCEIHGEQSNYFGLVWRHWVWWAAARGLKASAEREFGVPVL